MSNEITFRCSSSGYIMTDPRSKSEVLSETCKNHLVDVFVARKYGRTQDVQTKYTAKGLMVEEDSLTLYSRFTGQIYFKNEERICNQWICGTPDIIKPNLIDIKSSWDIFTFFRNHQDKLNKNYYWQLQGYMDLTGADKATLVYCLVNTPEVLISDEKRRNMWKMNVLESDKLFEEMAAEVERNSIYDDIPMEERIIEIEIERNQADIDRLHERVELCREYMNTHLFKSAVQ